MQIDVWRQRDSDEAMIDVTLALRLEKAPEDKTGFSPWLVVSHHRGQGWGRGPSTAPQRREGSMQDTWPHPNTMTENVALSSSGMVTRGGWVPIEGVEEVRIIIGFDST